MVEGIALRAGSILRAWAVRVRASEMWRTGA